MVCDQERALTNAIRFPPDLALIVELLRRYGEALFAPCPTSEQLVLFCEDPTSFSMPVVRSVQHHLWVCRDCRETVLWLTDSECVRYF